MRRYRPRRTRPEAERFWEKVDRSGGPDACWPWKQPPRKDGYGQFRFRGKTIGAHKAAWVISTGSTLERGTCVLHRCDNPICVNPTHLFTGDHAANVADKVAKGRHSRGETCGASKLTASAVREIRAFLTIGYSHASLALHFGVHPSAISRIGAKKRWRDCA